MKSFARLTFLTLLSAILLVACNSGGNTISDQGSSSGGSGSSGGSSPTASSVAALAVRTDTTQIPSDGSKQATITALVKDANNNVVSGEPVQFKADSGTLAVTQGTTDATGTATATLTTADNAANRAINVEADSAQKTAAVKVQVAGTSISIDGPSTLSTNNAGLYVLTLQDAGGNPLPDQEVTLSSKPGDTLTQSATTTDSKGQLKFSLQPVNSGTDTISAKALGAVGSETITVSSDFFDLTLDGIGCTTKQKEKTVIPLNQSCTLTATWKKSGVPQSGKTITFASTRGSITQTSKNTDSNGIAKVQISSSIAGPGEITATASGGPSGRTSVQFIAVNPAKIDLQVDNSTIAPNGTADLTAIVRDTNNNLVSNAKVTFAITADTTGGNLSTPSATTDFNGQAQTVYTAGSSTSAKDGVSIRAVVYDSAGTEIANDSVPLTVSSQAISITLGTGNKIEIPNDQQYKQPYVVQVADASGNPVPNATVDLSLIATGYFKGCWSSYDSMPPNTHTCSANGITATGNIATVTTSYARYTTVSNACDNEDTNDNGIFEPSVDNDVNGDGKLEPGIPGSVTPKKVTTDSTGSAQFGIYYPKDHAYWVAVKLTATAKVSGTERISTVQFLLQGAAADYNNSAVAVPGAISPYGVANSCSNPN